MRKIFLLTILLSFALGQNADLPEKSELYFKNLKDLEKKIVGSYKIAEGFFEEDLEVDRELFKLVLFEDNTLFCQIDFDVFVGTWHFIALTDYSGELLFQYDSGENFLLHNLIYQTPEEIKLGFFKDWKFREDKDFLLLNWERKNEEVYIFQKEIDYEK